MNLAQRMGCCFYNATTNNEDGDHISILHSVKNLAPIQG
jgi:hypothetical protein